MSESTRTADQVPLPGGDFRLFIQKLGYQALISLGVLDNPVTGERMPNPAGAEMLMEDLRMLQTKTRGNLEPAEEEHLTQVLAQLIEHADAVEKGTAEKAAAEGDAQA